MLGSAVLAILIVVALVVSCRPLPGPTAPKMTRDRRRAAKPLIEP